MTSAEASAPTENWNKQCSVNYMGSLFRIKFLITFERREVFAEEMLIKFRSFLYSVAGVELRICFLAVAVEV